MSEDINKLTEIATTDLIDELLSRCSPAIFIGHKTEEGGERATFWFWTGGDGCCYALCHEMSYYIQRNMVYFQTLDAIEGGE